MLLERMRSTNLALLWDDLGLENKKFVVKYVTQNMEKIMKITHEGPGSISRANFPTLPDQRPKVDKFKVPGRPVAFDSPDNPGVHG